MKHYVVTSNCFRYSGFYKGVQSAGAAVAWQIDVHSVSYLNQLIVNWVLTTVSYPLLLLLIIFGVKDEDLFEEQHTRNKGLMT